MKRVSGDIIEARQAELAIPLGFIVVDIVAGITLKLVLFNKDDSVRGWCRIPSSCRELASWSKVLG